MDLQQLGIGTRIRTDVQESGSHLDNAQVHTAETLKGQKGRKYFLIIYFAFIFCVQIIKHFHFWTFKIATTIVEWGSALTAIVDNVVVLVGGTATGGISASGTLTIASAIWDSL